MMNDDALVAAFHETREAERKAVVKWLRKQAAETIPSDEAAALSHAADMIEAGRHRDVE